MPIPLRNFIYLDHLQPKLVSLFGGGEKILVPCINGGKHNSDPRLQQFLYLAPDRLVGPRKSYTAGLQCAHKHGAQPVIRQQVLSFSTGFRYCPRCGSENISRARLRGGTDFLILLLLLRPFRCRSCWMRYYGFFFRRRSVTPAEEIGRER